MHVRSTCRLTSRTELFFSFMKESFHGKLDSSLFINPSRPRVQLTISRHLGIHPKKEVAVLVSACPLAVTAPRDSADSRVRVLPGYAGVLVPAFLVREG